MTDQQFIADAIKHKGKLTEWVRRMYGTEGFEMRKGNIVIKPSIIRRVAAGKCPICNLPMGRCVCPSKLTKAEAVLARTLSQIRDRRAMRRIDQ